MYSGTNTKTGTVETITLVNGSGTAKEAVRISLGGDGPKPPPNTGWDS